MKIWVLDATLNTHRVHGIGVLWVSLSVPYALIIYLLVLAN